MDFITGAGPENIVTIKVVGVGGVEFKDKWLGRRKMQRRRILAVILRNGTPDRGAGSR